MNQLFRQARESTRSPMDADRALSRRELAELVQGWIIENRRRDTPIDEVHIGKIERGEIRWPNADYRAAFRAVLGATADSDLGFSTRRADHTGSAGDSEAMRSSEIAPLPSVVGLDGIEAIELLQRVEATDVGHRTLAAIAESLGSLCRDYTHIAPAKLLPSLVAFQVLIGRLLDGRATLAQRRELVSQAGWLSLLTATADLDLGYSRGADANFAAARTMAAETDDLALGAAVHETQAWQALSRGDLARAAEHCHAGIALAPRSSSAYLQLCTQLARVSAKLGDADTTYAQVDEALTALDRSPRVRGQAEHHFVCDEGRVIMHSAAALVWLDDSSAIAADYARRAVAHYETDAEPKVHHLATARMNLALLLAGSGQPTEAASIGALAFESSWRLCQTDLFLAGDLDGALTGRYGNAHEVTEFHEHYLEMCATVTTHAPTPALPAPAGDG